MGMLSNIFHKIFPSSHPAVAQADTAAAPASPASGGPSSSAGTSPPPTSSAPPTASMPEVDVEQVLNNMLQASGQTLNWRTSIVDLLKLLGLDSSLQARKELASELGYSGDTNDSASMNVWLHRQVMNKLAANGGKVPADLKD
jgi:hypothetical protein